MKDKDFIKLNKTQKLKIEPSITELKGVDYALFIPLKRKSGGYTMCAFFVEKDGIWHRANDYDCFSFFFQEGLKGYGRLRGDFEYNGILFFLGGEYNLSYGGQFDYNK